MMRQAEFNTAVLDFGSVSIQKIKQIRFFFEMCWIYHVALCDAD